jgi:hypothetical protein
MAKKFMFVCFGILALAAAYAVGASNSVAQVGGSDVVASYVNSVASYPATVVVTANGDIYGRSGYVSGEGNIHWTVQEANWTFMGNALAGSVSSQPKTLGGVKNLFS